MNYIMKKIIGIPFLLIFINLGFILFESEVFKNPMKTIPILILNIFISIDILIRPISTKKDEHNRLIPAISFLSMPLIVLLPYLEFKLILDEITLLTHFSFHLFITGVILSVMGGVILLLSRIQIGQYGGPKIVVEDRHQLITNGFYEHVRHPIYLGFLFLFFGYSLAFGSFLMTILIFLFLFLIFNKRMEIEERLLIAEFGKKYELYLTRTKKLIPYLY